MAAFAALCTAPVRRGWRITPVAFALVVVTVIGVVALVLVRTLRPDRQARAFEAVAERAGATVAGGGVRVPHRIGLAGSPKPRRGGRRMDHRLPRPDPSVHGLAGPEPVSPKPRRSRLKPYWSAQTTWGSDAHFGRQRDAHRPFPFIRCRGNVFRPRRPVRPGRTGRSGRGR